MKKQELDSKLTKLGMISENIYGFQNNGVAEYIIKEDSNQFDVFYSEREELSLLNKFKTIEEVYDFIYQKHCCYKIRKQI